MATGRITLYLATSLDGYVASSDGDISWLENVEATDDGRYEEFVETVDCLLMGANTYEQVLSFGDWPYGDRPTFVTTHRDLALATDHVELVDDPVEELAAELTSKYDHCWLVGGADLAQASLTTEVVDEIRLTIMPILLGDGIPLFDDVSRQDLTLVDTTTHASGLVELRYR